MVSRHDPVLAPTEPKDWIEKWHICLPLGKEAL